MKSIKREMELWNSKTMELERTTSSWEKQIIDGQRKKLTYYIIKELLVQSKEINNIVDELDRSMDAILVFIGDEEQEIQYQKRKIKR